MAYDENTAERVRRILCGRRGLTERKMMGAICFMLSGHMCCGVMGTALMIRLGRGANERRQGGRHVRPMEIAGRRMTGFVLVDPDGFQTEAALAKWIQLGLDFVSTLPPKRTASKSH